MSDDLANLSAAASAELVRCREVSPVELTRAALERIEARNQRTNAFLTVIAEQALGAARRAERDVTADARLGALHGVPVAIKDLYAGKAGVRATQGCRAFADHVATSTTNHVQALEDAGAVVVGTTNTPEFGYKGTTDNRISGPTSTPFDLRMNAGGSSGGSAAAVADGLVPVAHGSDGGGSLRIPAALCGVFAMKATFGLVPIVARPDAFNLHTPYAHVGPLARTVEDAALMLDVLAVPHPRDPLCVPRPPGAYRDAVNLPVEGLRVAYSADLGGHPVEADVAGLVRAAVEDLAAGGAVVEEVKVTLPRPHDELAALWRRQSAARNAEAVESYRRAGIDLMGAHRHELTPGFIAVAEAGGRQSAVEYRLDDVMRTEAFDAVQDVFDSYDLLVTPVTSVAGVPNAVDGDTIGPRMVDGQEVDPLIGWCLTYLFNFTGQPAASVPVGLTPAGLPVGLQVVGRRFEDDRVLATAAALERVRPWSGTYALLHDQRSASGAGEDRPEAAR